MVAIASPVSSSTNHQRSHAGSVHDQIPNLIQSNQGSERSEEEWNDGDEDSTASTRINDINPFSSANCPTIDLLWRDRFRYWTSDFPNGIRDIRRRDLIDVGEAGIALCKDREGRIQLGQLWKGEFMRERAESYIRGNLGISHTIKMAISGNKQGSRWFMVENLTVSSQSNASSFHKFILNILDSLGHGYPGKQKCFIMDSNLIGHRDFPTLQAIKSTGHLFVLRATYWSNDSPVDYAFSSMNKIRTKRFMEEEQNLTDWQDFLSVLVRGYPNFVKHFENCGY